MKEELEMEWDAAIGSSRHKKLYQDSARETPNRAQGFRSSRLDEGGGEDVVVNQLPGSGKKQSRLTTEQVKLLESSFFTDLKLEPERKALLAKQLGLRPRQVAVWFQNRRARFKNKQLEQDYETLKANHEAVMRENQSILKANEAMLVNNKRLLDEVTRLTALLQDIGRNGIAAMMPGDVGDTPTTLDSGGLKLEHSSGKSDITSPTRKSSDHQSELQDSGRSYLTRAEPPAEASVEAVDEDFVAPCAGPLKFEIEYPPLFMSDELVESMLNPGRLSQLACNGLCLEDGCGFLLSWEDQ